MQKGLRPFKVPASQKKLLDARSLDFQSIESKTNDSDFEFNLIRVPIKNPIRVRPKNFLDLHNNLLSIYSRLLRRRRFSLRRIYSIKSIQVRRSDRLISTLHENIKRRVTYQLY